MGAKGIIGKTNWTIGEISPRAYGRFDADKPIYRDGCAILENWLPLQSGGIMFRPGTMYAGQIKNPSSAYSTPPVRFERFRYSNSQEYVLEIGASYMRFWAPVNGVLSQVLSGGNPLEISTSFVAADIFSLEVANKADVMYITHPNYFPQKLVRTSATSFSLTNAPMVRPPFLDVNISTTTITPSSDTGATTLTASAAIFLSGHVGSFWRVKGGVVKITVFTDTTHVTGTVQPEPDGTAGNLGTGPGAVTDWQEGAFSIVRGYPAAVTFHEQRLIYGGTTYQPQKSWASVVATYDDFDVGTAQDSDAWSYEIASNLVLDIRWLSSNTDLKIGTGGGTVTFKSQGTAGITASAPPLVVIDTDYAVDHAEPERIGGYMFYLDNSTFTLRQLVFDLIQNRDKSDDMTLLADHILRDGGGATQIYRQQSPCDRIWCVRNDGQISIFTRNAEQRVLSWCRAVMGYTASGPGVLETLTILPQDGADDIVCCVVKRVVNGTTYRFVEYFSAEIFTYDWDPVRLDAALSLDNPITISGVSNASPGVITANGHGFSNGDQIKIDNIVNYRVQTYTGIVTYGISALNKNVYLVANATTNTFTLTDTAGNAIDTTLMGTYISGGQVRKMNTVFSGLDYLNGETVSVMADGGLPAAQQTFVVSGGSITLQVAAAVVKIGLPYTGRLEFLPLSGDTQQISVTKKRKTYNVDLKVYRSLGGQFGMKNALTDTISLSNIIMPNQISQLAAYQTNPAYSGDIIDVDFESSVDDNVANIPVLYQTQPLPFMLLAAVLRSDIFEDK